MILSIYSYITLDRRNNQYLRVLGTPTNLDKTGLDYKKMRLDKLSDFEKREKCEACFYAFIDESGCVYDNCGLDNFINMLLERNYKINTKLTKVMKDMRKFEYKELLFVAEKIE